MSERLQLLLLRHGTAVTGSTDPGLSAEGRSGVDAMLRHPRLVDWSRLDLLLYSPLRRAVETAERVASRMAPSHSRAVPELLPDADAATAGRLLIRSLAGPDTHAAPDTQATPDTHATPDTQATPEASEEVPDTQVAEVPDTHGPLTDKKVPDTHAVPDVREDIPDTHAVPEKVPDTQVAEVPDTHAPLPAKRVCVVAHLPLLPALTRWLCDAEPDFATGCGWVLEGDPELAWQGTFARIGPVDDGGMW